jgi:phosphoribosylglycinamide formyltransferase-1
MKKIVFLVSGGGANLKFIQYALKSLSLNAKVVGVISDREIKFVNFLEIEKIEYSKINYKRSDNKEMLNELKRFNPDLIVTNIHKIIDEEVLSLFKDKFINLHYSLLPAFSGLIGMKTIEEAKKMNVKFVGGTCHEVNELVDAGNILFQGTFAVDSWEKQNIDLVIDTVFKLSCFLLLAGVLKKLNINSEISLKEAEINNFNVFFSPRLPFQTIEFTNEIFAKIK